MSNNLLTISEITYEALMVLTNECVFTEYVNRDLDQHFAVEGAKIGYTVNKRRPARFKGNVGPALAVEDFVESSVPVSLNTAFNVGVSFQTSDLLLSLDNFSRRVIKPAMEAIANKVDSDGLLFALQNTANAVGTPGSGLSSTQTLLNARALLKNEAAYGEYCAILGPSSHARLAGSVQGLFNPQKVISETYRKGRFGGGQFGFDEFLEDQNVKSYTVGAQGGTPQFSSSGTSTALISNGWQDSGTLNTKGWTASTNVVNVGDIITIAGVYSVNPQSRDPFDVPTLRQFVVRPPNGSPANGTFTPITNSFGQQIGGQYTSDAGGLLQLTIAPSIIAAPSQFQNVTALPVNNAAITVFGAPGVMSGQNIAMARDAFALVMAELPIPEGVDMAGRASDNDAGLSIRLVRQYTINNDQLPTRFDVLYGYASLYRELAVRIAA